MLKENLYTIMPLDTEHIDEICEDIRKQYEDGVAACALFSMTLVPEGTPPANKAEMMCEKYEMFREKLSAAGMPSGVLVQASIGHGWVLSEMFPYQRYVNFNDGKETNTACPYDEGVRAYLYNAMKTIASHNPDCIMVDDDFRLMYRDGNGCGCPLHMKRFNTLAGTDFSRERLWKSVCADTNEGRKNAEIMIETQKESLVQTAKIMRAGIDSVNPALRGSFCCVGYNAEFAYEIASILAGKGNPIVVRINNGNYTPAGARYFSNVFFRAAAQIAKLKDKADVILAETDTCPQNRYSTGAMSLHTHFTGTILEGAKGAKHWITRLSAFEPESGTAYRKVLGKYSGFYQALAEIEPALNWRGFRIPVSDTPAFTFGKAWGGDAEKPSAWSMCVLERLGLPLYFSAQKGGVVCLEGEADARLSDEEIMEILKGPVFLASDTAQRLIRRGFGPHLGVEVREWRGKQPSFEKLSVNGNAASVQMKVKELVPVSNATLEDSVVYHSVDKVKLERLFPGTTIYKNTLGGTVFVFSGTPRADFNILEAFSFLTYSRKQQLIKMLEQTEELPVYYPNDEEVYLRAADTKDGGLFCAVFNISLDPIEKLELVCKRSVSKIEKLMPDGTKLEIDFELTGKKYILDTPCNTLEPVILFISGQ